MALAMLLARQGHEKEALEQAEEAGRVAPNDPRPKELVKEIHAKFDKERQEKEKQPEKDKDKPEKSSEKEKDKP
jgi:hypothetical protein